MRLIRITTLCALLAVAPPALADEGGWHREDGASLRVVAATPEADGTLRAALQIRLEPGWKTYWLDPGESGVPPTLSVDDRAVAETKLHFPAPERFDDGYSLWAGYDHSIDLPITLDLAASPASGRLEADIFIGVCETICVPVQARLAFDVGAGPSLGEREAVVTEAFDALPDAEREDMRVELLDADPARLTVKAEVPEGVAIEDLFVASTDGLTLAMAEPVSGRPGVFSVKVIGGEPKGAAPFYTLVTSHGAVAGELSAK